MNLNERIYYSRLEYEIPQVGKKHLTGHTYCLLLRFGKNVLVNTGVLPMQTQMETLFSEAGIRYAGLDGVVLTDSAPLHSGLDRAIYAKNRNVTFYAHPGAVEPLADISLQAAQCHIPGILKLLSGDIKGVVPVEDGQKFHLGGETAEIIFTPGHAPECIALFLEKSGVLVTGNAVAEPLNKPVYTDLQALYRTLEKLEKVKCRYYFTSFSGLVKRSERDIVRDARLFLDKIDTLVRKKYKETRDVDVIAEHVLDTLKSPYRADHDVRVAIAQHIPDGK